MGVFAGAIVPVLLDGRMRCQPFEPHLVIVVQVTLVVICQKNTIVVHQIDYLSRSEPG
jgi:hypothetical protein